MTLKTITDWQSFIKQQKQSPLTITEFCEQHKISVSCFYKHKAGLKRSEEKDPSFIKVKPPKANLSSPTHHAIKVQHGKTRLHLPSQLSPQWLAEFIKALA